MRCEYEKCPLYGKDNMERITALCVNVIKNQALGPHTAIKRQDSTFVHPFSRSFFSKMDLDNQLKLQFIYDFIVLNHTMRYAQKARALYQAVLERIKMIHSICVIKPQK